MRRLIAAAGITLATLGLAACAVIGPTSPIDWDDELDLGAPGEAISTTTGVEYYPACGNEVLSHDGRQWYQFNPSNSGDFTAPATTASALGASLHVGWGFSVGAVVAPGPGDDTGTLTVFEGGFAHWVSDSGELERWLTDRELEYRWVC